jgi:hypothetical protein
MTGKVLNLFTHILSKGITMAYPNAQQGKALPFFARFLSLSEEEQVDYDYSSLPWTFKFPSDWEDSF